MVVAPNDETYALKVNDFQSLQNKIDADWNNAEGNSNKEKERNIENL